MPRKKDILTDRQKLFCQYYLQDFNGTQAYVKAFKTKRTTGNVEASRLLAKPVIKSYLNKLKKELTHSIFLESQHIFKKMVELAFSDIGNYVKWHSKEQVLYNAFGQIVKDEEGNPIKAMKNYIELNDSSKVDTSLIEEISKGKDGVKVKLKDSKQALTYLTKYFDMFPDKFQRKIEEAKLDILKKNSNYDNTPNKFVIVDKYNMLKDSDKKE